MPRYRQTLNDLSMQARSMSIAIWEVSTDAASRQENYTWKNISDAMAWITRSSDMGRSMARGQTCGTVCIGTSARVYWKERFNSGGRKKTSGSTFTCVMRRV